MSFDLFRHSQNSKNTAVVLISSICSCVFNVENTLTICLCASSWSLLVFFVVFFPNGVFSALIIDYFSQIVYCSFMSPGKKTVQLLLAYIEQQLANSYR